MTYLTLLLVSIKCVLDLHNELKKKGLFFWTVKILLLVSESVMSVASFKILNDVTL